MPRGLDRLTGDTPGPKRSLSVLDLGELAPGLRRVMQWVMRAGECTDADLRRALDSQPQGDPLSYADLQDALRTLLAEEWLVRTGESEPATYRLHLTRRRGHVRDPQPAPGQRPTMTMKGIWDKAIPESPLPDDPET